MINNCEYIVGGFVKKNILTDVKTNSLQERMTTLYPVIGQVLSIKNVLNIKKDKSIYDYLSFVYEDFNPLSNYPIQDTDYDEELANNLKQLESNNSINVRAINNINNYEELIELEFLSNLYQNLSDIQNNYDIPDFDIMYKDFNITYNQNSNTLLIDGMKIDTNFLLLDIKTEISIVNSRISLNSKDILEYYLNKKETGSYFEQISNMLLDNIDKISNPIVKFNISLNDKGTAGKFSARENNIELFKLNKNVFLHELIHGYTFSIVHKSQIGALLSENESKFINNITDLYNKAVEYNDTYNESKYYYGLKNIHEFLADGLSDIKFQQFLHNITLEGEQDSIFTKLINAVKKLILGYSEDTTNTVLSKLINDTMNYITNIPVIDKIESIQDYNILLGINEAIQAIGNISKNPHTLTIDNYKDAQRIDNITGEIFTIEYYGIIDVWSKLMHLYEKNNNEIYPEILSDFIDYLKNRRDKLRQKLYNSVEPNDIDAMKHVLDKLKIADKEYFDELSRYMSNNKDIINVYDNTLKEEYDLTINPDEGTKISYCK